MGQTSYVVYPARVAIVPGTDHEDLCGQWFRSKGHGILHNGGWISGQTCL